MPARLCATVTGATTAELRARRDAQDGADLVELRLDTVAAPDAAGALAGRRAPVVVTCRPAWEGGAFAGGEEERRRILLDACRLGAEYVDVEHRAGFAGEVLAARGGRGVVLSFHAFDGAPADLEARYRAMRGAGAEVVKIAAAAGSLTEALRVAALGTGEEPRALIAMGAAGVPTRVLAGRFGSCWTYAGDGVAPGQIDLERMRRTFRFHELSGRTAVYGVLGAPVGHSLSPAVHNAGFRAHGVDAVYLPLEAAGVDDFLAFAEAAGLRGASVTAPFKEEIAPRVAGMDAAGRAIGAVNTLRRLDGGGWEAINTDAAGLLAPLQNREQVEDYARRGVTAFAMELVPRISRAQGMDALSSQSNLAGYKAVLDAAAEFGKVIPMMMTAAGTVAPARILVLGAGVAGLQAVATARRLGGVVSAFDVRPAAKEQVESLGAKFVEVADEEAESAETAGGYAREMNDDYRRRQRALIHETLKGQDIAICTALIPGKPAPTLITAAMAADMKPGSVIVDLATETGGNCELSRHGEVVREGGVTIIGHANVPGRVPVDASALYARNLLNFVGPMIDKDSGALAIDWDDEVISGACVARGGAAAGTNGEGS